MLDKSSLPLVPETVPVLHIGRAYNARDAAAILGVSESVLKPIFASGDRRYSGYVLARLMGWPVSENPTDFMPGENEVADVGGRPESRRRLRLALR